MVKKKKTISIEEYLRRFSEKQKKSLIMLGYPISYGKKPKKLTLQQKKADFYSGLRNKKTRVSSERRNRKEKFKKVGETIQNSYGFKGEIGSTRRESKGEFFDRVPNQPGKKVERKYTKLGGMGTPLSKIKSKDVGGGERQTIKSTKSTQHQVNMTKPRVSNKVRILDEINSAAWGDKHPSKIVQAYSAAHKRQQEMNKKKAMKKHKKPYNRKGDQGHNLKTGKADGDKGRRMSAQQRRKR